MHSNQSHTKGNENNCPNMHTTYWRSIMFYNYAQFKKATKILLEEMKAETFKLSGLRLRLVQLMGFSTVEAYEATFNREAPKTITVITIAPQMNVFKKDFTANEEGRRHKLTSLKRSLKLNQTWTKLSLNAFLMMASMPKVIRNTSSISFITTIN